MWSSLIGGRYCCHVSSGRAGLLSLMAPYVNVDITVSRPPQPAVAAFHRRCITGENLLPRIYRSWIWCGVNRIMARVRFKLTSFCPWTVNMKIQGSKKYILICYCFAVESKNIITNAMQHRLVFLVGVWTRVVIYHSPVFPSFPLGYVHTGLGAVPGPTGEDISAHLKEAVDPHRRTTPAAPLRTDRLLCVMSSRKMEFLQVHVDVGGARQNQRWTEGWGGTTGRRTWGTEVRHCLLEKLEKINERERSPVGSGQPRPFTVGKFHFFWGQTFGNVIIR